MNLAGRSLGLIGLFALLLTACSPVDEVDSSQQIETSQSQAYYFLESLKFVEQSGRQLQASDRTQASVEQALLGMDAGMALAFNVDTRFLDEVDVRLGKNYQRYFIEGVQAYRLGIEAADPEAQKKGLALLSRWAQFWGRNQSAILPKLQIYNPS